MVDTQVDAEDLAILKHALGLDRGTQPYRNYYVAPEPSADFSSCGRLVKLGLMVPFGESNGGGHIFHVTRRGADYLAVTLSAKLTD